MYPGTNFHVSLMFRITDVFLMYVDYSFLDLIYRNE